MKIKYLSYQCALVAGLSLAAMPQAFAAGTAAGTDVSNTASVAYKVGAVDRSATSNTVTFKVDRKINLTVAEVGGAATLSVPGSTAQFTTFTVTNNSNATLDFRLGATQDAGGTAVFGGTDNFDVTAFAVYVESGATPGYQPLEDIATFIDELGPDLPKTVYVVGNVAAGRVDGDVAGVTLTATAAQDATTAANGVYTATPGVLASDAAQTNTGVADVTTFIDTVFADPLTGVSAARNGADSARDQFTVRTAVIAMTKSSTVVSDPFNLLVNPKAIPGATIEYCLDVNNTGAGVAGTIVLTDAIPANTSYVVGSLKTAATGAGAACTVGSGLAEDDDATGADETDPDGADYNITTASAITVRTPSINGGSRFKATFRVLVL